ncbi:MAG: pyridoxamine 5'-phosphate oxidase [Bacteroidia bacterium]
MSQHKEKIKQLREDFTKDTLSEAKVNKAPSAQFDAWISQAIAAEIPEVQAMTLSTVSADGKPSSRVVYLREFENDRFWFYGNYDSRKAKDMFSNPNVSLNFFWPGLERQIRIEGKVIKADAKTSDDYFSQRPPESKIGAWSSPQSKPLSSREELEALVQANRKKFEGKEVPRPEFWGGFVVQANYYEFWQGRKSRLHDRLCYSFESGTWIIRRLAP